jgi:hypothetical protein
VGRFYTGVVIGVLVALLLLVAIFTAHIWGPIIDGTVVCKWV